MRDHPVLADLARFGVKLGLDRMGSFLEAAGAPHRVHPVVHVAGTNGKGSVVAMVESVLRAQGLRVGVTTSPHLEDLNERIRVDGQDVSDDVIEEGIAALVAVREAWAAHAGVEGDHALTYFELVTALAFWVFAREDLDVVVVEVGLGGRLDATNVVDPLVSVIASVGLDHTEQLGSDLASIAAEKAGIVKPGRPVVTGPLRAPALRVVRSIAADRGAPFHPHGEAWRMRVSGEGLLSWRMGEQTYRDLEVGLDGEHQLENAGVALAALHLLPEGLRPSEESVRAGLAAVRHPGRLEWLSERLLLDCAHNADGAARLAAYLAGRPRDARRTLLLGMSSDKDPRSLLVTLAPQVDRVLTTCCAHPRAMEPGELAAALVDVDLPVLPAGPIEEALPRALDGEGLVLVAGSVFLAGAVRSLWASG